MTLGELIAPSSVIIDVRASDKAQVLGELARQAASRAGIEREAVFAALVAREALGSTGLGHGFALPHARVAGVSRLFGLFARLSRPIDYQGIDGQRVDLICLLLIPPQASDHVGALAAITRPMRDERIRLQVRQAPDAAALHRVLVAQT